MTTSTARFAACAAIILASCSHPSQSPTAPSSALPALDPPPLAVLVDRQRGATAIAGVSEIAIDATVAGDTKLRYQVDYGDGSSSTQPASKHVYANVGTFHITASMTDAAGRTSSAAQDVSVAAMTGAWFQFGVNDAIHRFEARRISIAQDGTQVRGTYFAFGEPDRRITGQLTANRRITLMTDDGAARLEGTLPLTLSDAGYPITLTPLGNAAGPLHFDPVPHDPPPSPPNAELRVRNEIPGSYSDYLVVGLESTFDATQSTGDGLSFVIDFGDGTFATTADARHVLLTALSLPESVDSSARAFVVDRFGRVDSETVSFPLHRLFTYLYNYFQNPAATGGRDERYLSFGHQNGTVFTGTYSGPEGPSAPLTATLSGGNHIHIRLDDGTIDMDGTITFERPVWNGPVFFAPRYPPYLILRVRGGSADGAELIFSDYT